jgi:hypothetical protein
MICEKCHWFDECNLKPTTNNQCPYFKKLEYIKSDLEKHIEETFRKYL